MIKEKTRAMISKSALRHNYLTIAQHLKDHTPAGETVPEVISVVKANAYGHNVRIAAEVLGDAGCRFFAVSSAEEALEIRALEAARGRQPRILILGYTLPENVPEMVSEHILLTAVSTEHALAMADAAEKAGTLPLRIHIKLDTGMNRVGFSAYEEEISRTVDAVAMLAADPRIEIAGIFTHYACCDDEMSPDCTAGEEMMTMRQYNRFLEVRRLLTERGISCGFCHTANSAAIYTYPQTYLDGVRAGIALYGISPDGKHHPELHLRPVMRLETTVAHIHTLPAGEHVSYGATFTADKPLTLATLTIGYGDGYLRCYSPSSVTIGGQKFPIVGRICMDQCMVDITDAKMPVRPGDTAVLFGDDDGETLLRMAEYGHTIPYECLCAISGRVVRIAEE
ncbi:MAG: alanine racemase [Clostridia bacterium]|nr:alanine racemase [Clostridia bacterium]